MSISRKMMATGARLPEFSELWATSGDYVDMTAPAAFGANMVDESFSTGEAKTWTTTISAQSAEAWCSMTSMVLPTLGVIGTLACRVKVYASNNTGQSTGATHALRIYDEIDGNYVLSATFHQSPGVTYDGTTTVWTVNAGGTNPLGAGVSPFGNSSAAANQFWNNLQVQIELTQPGGWSDSIRDPQSSHWGCKIDVT